MIFENLSDLISLNIVSWLNIELIELCTDRSRLILFVASDDSSINQSKWSESTKQNQSVTIHSY
jgi:hypothetical protein